MAVVPFESLVAAHHGEIYRFLRRVSGRRDLADDLSQETFLRAFRGYASLNGHANVRAWMFTIAANVARNYARGERRRHNARSAMVATAGAQADRDRLRQREIRTSIEQAILELPPKQRVAFVMRKFHDADYAAVAAALQCSQDSARAHVFQALKKVRRSLEGQMRKDRM
jgi:RNA polymerase sigma-70 factor (ECF subfamily)